MSMRLYLIQHGEAKSAEEDPGRGLTPKGEAQTGRSAAFLEAVKPGIAEIWHSGKLRAAQTAAILAAALKADNLPREHAGLSPNDPVQPVAREIKTAGRTIAVVGHLPFLSRLTSLLVCGHENGQPVSFFNSGIVCLNYSGEAWQVEWAVSPPLLNTLTAGH
jgi:phosphohistidine phosphatase